MAMATATEIANGHAMATASVTVSATAKATATATATVMAVTTAPQHSQYTNAGKATVFDDSFEHEVWNDHAVLPRYVLSVHVWHPALMPLVRCGWTCVWTRAWTCV